MILSGRLWIQCCCSINTINILMPNTILTHLLKSASCNDANGLNAGAAGLSGFSTLLQHACNNMASSVSRSSMLRSITALEGKYLNHTTYTETHTHSHTYTHACVHTYVHMHTNTCIMCMYVTTCTSGHL